MASEGIFDPEQAPSIEAKALRGYLFDIMSTNFLVLEDAEGDRLANLAPPRADEQMTRAENWHNDYVDTYAVDPLEGIDPEMLDETVPRLELPDESAEG